jgi:hypothetical protein
VAATARYSASVEECATERCLREAQETTLPPKNKMYAVVDVRSSGLPAQLKSKKADNVVEVFDTYGELIPLLLLFNCFCCPCIFLFLFFFPCQ